MGCLNGVLTSSYRREMDCPIDCSNRLLQKHTARTNRAVLCNDVGDGASQTSSKARLFRSQTATRQQRLDLRFAATKLFERSHRVFGTTAAEQLGAEPIAILAA